MEDGFGEKLLSSAAVAFSAAAAASAAVVASTAVGFDKCRMVHFRPMVVWSFSLSFITEMPLTKFEQDLSHLRKKISVATILDGLSKF